MGQSPAIEKIKSIAMKIAGTDLSVLIEGEMEREKNYSPVPSIMNRNEEISRLSL